MLEILLHSLSQELQYFQYSSPLLPHLDSEATFCRGRQVSCLYLITSSKESEGHDRLSDVSSILQLRLHPGHLSEGESFHTENPLLLAGDQALKQSLPSSAVGTAFPRLGSCFGQGNMLCFFLLQILQSCLSVLVGFLSVFNVFVCLFPSPKNPHRCSAVTFLWMTNTLSLALGIRRPRFMKLFIKDKSSCKLDSSLQHFVLSSFCSPASETKDFQYSLQSWSSVPTFPHFLPAVEL